MIRNEEELAVIRQQLALVEDELAILRCDVLPQGRREHDVQCEQHIDQIAALRAEIAAFRAGATAERPAAAEYPVVLADQFVIGQP